MVRSLFLAPSLLASIRRAGDVDLLGVAFWVNRNLAGEFAEPTAPAVILAIGAKLLAVECAMGADCACRYFSTSVL